MLSKKKVSFKVLRKMPGYAQIHKLDLSRPRSYYCNTCPLCHHFQVILNFEAKPFFIISSAECPITHSKCYSLITIL